MPSASSEDTAPVRSVQSLEGRTFGAVLFDMDGTLIDSIAAVERSWATWAAEYDIDLHRLRGFHGIPASGVTAALRPDLSADDRARAVRRIEELEVADTDGIVVLPGAGEALEALAAGGARAAIVTSCTDPLAEARIEATGLRRPEVIVTHPPTGLTGVGRAPATCLTGLGRALRGVPDPGRSKFSGHGR